MSRYENLTDAEVEVLAAEGFENAEREVQDRMRAKLTLAELWSLVERCDEFAAKALMKRVVLLDVLARFDAGEQEPAGEAFNGCEGIGTVVYLNDEGGYIVRDVTPESVTYEFNPLGDGEPVVFELEVK
jgi:hypothetical protein